MILRECKAALVLALLVPATAQAQIVEDEPPRQDVQIGVVGPSDPRATAIYAQTRETRDDVRHSVEAGRMSKSQGKSFKKESRRIDSLASRQSWNGTMSESAARELTMASRALDSMANAPAAREARRSRDKD